MAAQLHIIGGGLAGSEAAWQAAESGIAVILHEMRPVRGTEAHQTDSLAELVCSNSFRSDDAANNAVGLLHEEMRRAGNDNQPDLRSLRQCCSHFFQSLHITKLVVVSVDQ